MCIYIYAYTHMNVLRSPTPMALSRWSAASLKIGLLRSPTPMALALYGPLHPPKLVFWGPLLLWPSRYDGGESDNDGTG